MNFRLSLLLSTLILAGCGVLPLRPGYSRVTPQGAEVHQSQNPQSASKQIYEKSTETLLPGTTNTVRTIERVETEIGAAQKDTAREIGAKLSSLKGVVWVGVLVFIFGAASAFYPPLKVVVGSVTTSAILAVAGIALIVLPTVIVGHELLLIGGAAAVVGLYWFAHRHGSLRGALDTLKGK